MTKERCSHVENQIVDLVDRFQNWRGYECPYCEIERLKNELKIQDDANEILTRRLAESGIEPKGFIEVNLYPEPQK